MPSGDRRVKKPVGSRKKLRSADVENPADSPANAGGRRKRGGNQTTQGTEGAQAKKEVITAAQLDTIEECASVGCTLEEAADNAGTTKDDILDSEAAMAAFRRGANKAKFALAKVIMEMAKQGQPQMVTQALKLFEKQSAEMPGERLPSLDELM